MNLPELEEADKRIAPVRKLLNDLHDMVVGLRSQATAETGKQERLKALDAEITAKHAELAAAGDVLNAAQRATAEKLAGLRAEEERESARVAARKVELEHDLRNAEQGVVGRKATLDLEYADLRGRLQEERTKLQAEVDKLNDLLGPLRAKARVLIAD